MQDVFVNEFLTPTANATDVVRAHLHVDFDANFLRFFEFVPASGERIGDGFEFFVDFFTGGFVAAMCGANFVGFFKGHVVSSVERH